MSRERIKDLANPFEGEAGIASASPDILGGSFFIFGLTGMPSSWLPPGGWPTIPEPDRVSPRLKYLLPQLQFQEIHIHEYTLVNGNSKVIMAAAAEVQGLLRFLTKEGRLPLTEAMPKINSLRKLDLNTPEKIAQAPNADLKTVFTDEKVLKQIVNAAKRATNPRKKPATQSRPFKQQQPGHTRQAGDESGLALPEFDSSEDDLEKAVIETNRAPLFLAFTLSILKYTHPEQPVSSRLSLAQAVVSAGAQSKAKSIGLTTGPTAEEDGWLQGQPRTRIMGRDVAVMRRQISNDTSIGDTQETVGTENIMHTSHEAFWGIDLEALRKSNGPLIAGKNQKGNSGPPIHTPESARNYLLRSMDVVAQSPDSPSRKKKKTALETTARKEEAAGMVLKAIDIVLDSWKETVSMAELERRTQSWYAMVRPEVAQGQAGWGQRGHLPLRHILRLKRTS